MIIFCFITTINLHTLLLYHLHVSLGLQLIKKPLYDKYYQAFLRRFMALRPRILVQKKKHQNRAFCRGNQSIMGKGQAEIHSFQYPPTAS